MTPPFLTDPTHTLTTLDEAFDEVAQPPCTPQFLTDPTAIREWLATYFYCNGDITISVDGRVSVAGTVLVTPCGQQELTHFAVQFDHVSSTFLCSECVKLTTLRGAPRFVGGNFSCGFCTALTSLEGAPETVNDSFYCCGCAKLKTLDGMSPHIGKSVNCSACPKLISLRGVPPHLPFGGFNCSGCLSLATLVGSPIAIGGDFECASCPQLKNLEGAPHVGGNMDCREMPNLSLVGANAVEQYLRVSDLKKPEPAAVEALLRHRIRLNTSQKTKWVALVNSYHTSGDLLTAIARFEAYFKVPFHDILKTPLSEIIPEL